MTNLVKRQHISTRTLEAAINNAIRLENELPYLIQPEKSTFDLITLKNALQYIWIQTSNSTNIICGIWKSEPTIEQRIIEYSAYLEKEVTFEDVKCNTILKEYKVNI